MASSTLNANEIGALNQADRSIIVSALGSLTLPDSAGWFPSTHTALNGIEKSHKPAGTSAISSAALAEYLAIACPTHCADGWAYLSRSLCSYILGDPHSAWHFAYYAELRAAQSILSGLGCGAFNTWNCTLDANGQIHPAGEKPTHVMVWLALKHLAENNVNAVSAISSATRILGVAVPDVIQYAYAGASPGSTSLGWICSWLYDLERGIEDKSFRNKCSYNPHIVTPHSANLPDCVDLVSTFWELLQPAPGAAFMELDRQILRLALRKVASETLLLRTGTSPDENELTAEIEQAYTRIISAAPTFESIPAEYFSSPTRQNPIMNYGCDYSPTPATPRPILARATLLLRLASGIAQNLLNDAGQSSKINFWLDDLAVRQGLVEKSSDIPENRQDFYADCIDEADSIKQKMVSGVNNMSSLFFASMVKPHLAAQAERVVQWGLAS